MEYDWHLKRIVFLVITRPISERMLRTKLHQTTTIMCRTYQITQQRSLLFRSIVWKTKETGKKAEEDMQAADRYSIFKL